MRQDLLCLTPAMRRRPAPVSAETARVIDALLPELRRIARALCESWAEADNLVQDTLLAIWSDPDRLDPDPEILRHQVRAQLKAGPVRRGTRDVA